MNSRTIASNVDSDPVAAANGNAVQVPVHSFGSRLRGRVDGIVDSLPLIVWVHDDESRQVYVNETFCAYFGVTRDQVHNQGWQALMHQDDAAAYAEAFMNSVREQVPFHAEVRVRRADGEWRWLESWARPYFSSDGTFIGHVGTSADVTERKQTEAQQLLLVQEMNHRVKNTLAVVQALAQQTFSSLVSADALRAFHGRLAALSTANDLLVSGNWQGTTLHELVRSTVASTCGHSENLELSGTDIEVAAAAAGSLALAIHELCTNAIKYGAFSVPDGRVMVQTSIESTLKPTLVITWCEIGGPAVAASGPKGFGTRLLNTLFTGGVDMRLQPEGLVCTLRKPFEDLPLYQD